MTAGRSSSLTEERIKLLEEGLRKGYTHKDACALAGIDRDTFYRWRREAKTEGATDMQIEFAARVERAEAEAAMEMQDMVRGAAHIPEFWPAAMTWLERRRPEDYSLHHRGRRLERLLQKMVNADTAKRHIDLEELESSIYEMWANGEISTDEAAKGIDMVAKTAKIAEITELKATVARIQEKLK